MGQRLFQVNAGDEPPAIDHLAVLEALASLPSMPDSYWERLEESAQAFEANRKPASYLLSYGPDTKTSTLHGRHPFPDSNAKMVFSIGSSNASVTNGTVSHLPMHRIRNSFET